MTGLTNALTSITMVLGAMLLVTAILTGVARRFTRTRR
jgi:hypothetical protein